MAVVITYNPNIYSIFQTFYTARQIDLIESLAWLTNDEKSMGVSEEQGNMIVYLAQFYFTVIQLLRQTTDPAWEYLDWLTQDEYDTIMYKLELTGATPDIISVPGGALVIPTATPIAGSNIQQYIQMFNLAAEDTLHLTTTLNVKPHSVMLIDSEGNILGTEGIKMRMVSGVYIFDIYSSDDLIGVELKILYVSDVAVPPSSISPYTVWTVGGYMFREGIRGDEFVTDQALTPLGFDGVEGSDWGNISHVKYEVIL